MEQPDHGTSAQRASLATLPWAHARVVLITRDEYDMIGDCLDFYSRALGAADRVFVVDNGSTNERVLRAYAKHRAAGGRVVVDRRPFNQAVDFMTEHMTAVGETCQWLMPMETDEIVYASSQPPPTAASTVARKGHDAVVVDRRGAALGDCVADVTPEAVGDAIRSELAALTDDVGLVRYGRVLASVVDPSDDGYLHGAYERPIRQATRFAEQGWDKLIVRSAAFWRMKMWCHHAQLRPGFREVTSGALGLLHFHDTGRRRQVERAYPVVESYGYMPTDRTVDGARAEELLERAMSLRDAPIACGHKMRYVADHLARRAVLAAFLRYVGRLPGSAEEMRAFLPAPDGGDRHHHPADAVRRALAQGQLSRRAIPLKASDAPPTHEELLYAEDCSGDASGCERFRVCLDDPHDDDAVLQRAASNRRPTWMVGWL